MFPHTFHIDSLLDVGFPPFQPSLMLNLLGHSYSPLLRYLHVLWSQVSQRPFQQNVNLIYQVYEHIFLGGKGFFCRHSEVGPCTQ